MSIPQRVNYGYRDLRAWQLAVALTKSIYELSASWPQSETYGLTSQIRRAAVSVPANIAEGKGRISKREFRHHLSIAHGSLCEVETLIYLALALGYCSSEQERAVMAHSSETGRTISGLIRSLGDE